MADAPDTTAEDAATDAEIADLIQALARGERAFYWGSGETKGEGEPRLTLWQEGRRLYLQGRGGIDFGAFGSLRLAYRFMGPILAEEAESSV